MLKFKYRSLKALPRFFAFRNEVDIYTEDNVNDKEFYKALFSRLTEGKVKIQDITPLGSKRNVLKAFDEQDKNSKRKSIFIVDGDLDLIIGTNRISNDNLVVLDSYCIENYLIDEKASLEIIYYSNGTTDKEKLSTKFNFDKWLGYNRKTLIDLFLNFAILKKYNGGPVIKSASVFLKEYKKQVILNIESINEYTEEIKNKIIEKLEELKVDDPEKVYSEELDNLKRYWTYSNETMLRIISGKDYLFPLLQHRINHSIGKGKMLFKNKSLKLFLAKHCDLKRLDFLKRKLI